MQIYRQPQVGRLRPKRASGNVCTAICSSIDPFCAAACGSKSMDTNTIPTIPYTIKYRTTITTDSGGQKVVMMQPNLITFVKTSATFTGGSEVATWNTSVSVPEYANLATYFEQYRIVSYGCRVFCSAAMSESQGTVLMALSRQQDTFDTASSNYADIRAFALNGLDATMVSKATGPESDSWNDLNATSERMYMYVALTGAAPASGVAGLEVTLNVEFVPKVGLGSRLATTAPAVPRAIKDAQERVERRTPAIMDGPSEVRSKTMMQYAAEAISWAADHPAEIVAGLSYLGL